MEQQLTDWVDFCENRKKFNKSHFLTLFMEGKAENGRRSEEELKIIFKFLPHSEELLKRMKNVLYGNKAKKPSDIEQYLIENTRQDLLQKKIVLEQENEDELLELVQKPVEYVSDIKKISESRKNNWPDEELHCVISDYFIQKTPGDDITAALKEAFYGLVHDYDLVRYLVRPLIDTDINLDYYYNIWSVGGDYSVTEDGIIVSRHIPK